MGYREAYESWLNNPYFDEDTKQELRNIANDEKEMEDRFYMDLEFGTAGLRGVIGAGTNRMNVYTVRKATQGLSNYIIKVGAQAKGVAIAYDSRRMSPEFANEAALCLALANYIIKQGGADKGVAIAFDSRHMSPEFAMEAAMTLAANGIKAYKFESLRPTPELSYAVRYLGCTAGINVTASHNPPEYNGYKVYWEDGAQITPPHDSGIMAEVKAVTDYATTKTMSKEDAVAAGLYEVIGANIDDPYIAELKKLVLNQDAINAVADDLKIVYTPLHGTGNIPVRRVLKELGFKHVYVVPEQELPDGEFPTVSYPNPEAAEAFTLGLGMAKELDADLVLATDPDADRLGVYVKDSKTGIVSTNLADAIAADYGVKLYEVLTGFKFIGQKMLEFETKGNGTYLFGMEESYGCLPGTYCRDKDAVVASMALCEAAAYYKTQGKTLWDAMLDLYEKYGYYKDDVKAITLKGIEGLAKIQEIMTTLRDNTPAQIGEYKVLKARDYKKDTVTDLATGEVTPTGLPNSNVLYYELPDAAWVCFRPSGTEPKLKFYYGVKADTMEAADAKAAELGAAVMAIVEPILARRKQTVFMLKTI